MKHIAYNIETGEVITTNHSNYLKRCVKQANHWNRAHNYPLGKWLFAHNEQGIERIRREINARATQNS